MKPSSKLGFMSLESPAYTKDRFKFLRNVTKHIDFFVSYRKNSTIFYPYGHICTTLEKVPKTRNIGDEKFAMAMISNCDNRERINLVKRIKEILGENLYLAGRCFKNPVDNHYVSLKNMTKLEKIHSMIKRHRFFLAFENSACDEYITEKVWRTLNLGVIPIIRAAEEATFKSQLPPNSYVYISKDAAKSKETIKTLIDGIDYAKLTDWSRKDQIESLKQKHQCHKSYSDEMRLCQLCKKLVNQEDFNLPAENLAKWWYRDTCDKDYHYNKFKR